MISGHMSFVCIRIGVALAKIVNALTGLKGKSADYDRAIDNAIVLIKDLYDDEEEVE